MSDAYQEYLQYRDEGYGRDLLVSLTVATLIAVGGGILSGIAISTHGILGLVGLSLSGVFGGFAAAKLLERNVAIASLVGISVVLAMLIAMITWNWHSSPGDITWLEAAERLRWFLDCQHKMALLASLSTIIGVFFAYRQAA